MKLLRGSLVSALVVAAILPGCGILEKLKGNKDAGVAFDLDAGLTVTDAATADEPAADDAGDAGLALQPASAPIIGACKPNDVADCTNKCQVLKQQPSCVNLGIMFANGSGVPTDLGKAATLFQGACNASVGAGCDHFGLALQFGRGIQADLPRAIDTLKKGCDLKNAEACNRRALMAERAQGGPKDSVTAVTFYQKACDLGDAFGCGNLAESPRERRRHPEGRGACRGAAQDGMRQGRSAGLQRAGGERRRRRHRGRPAASVIARARRRRSSSSAIARESSRTWPARRKQRTHHRWRSAAVGSPGRGLARPALRSRRGRPRSSRCAFGAPAVRDERGGRL